MKTTIVLKSAELMGALLMEIHEGWQTGRAYLNLTEYLAQKTEPANETTKLSAASSCWTNLHTFLDLTLTRI